jgi:hypothetical protein
MNSWQIFSPMLQTVSTLLIISFAVQMLFSLMQSYFFFFALAFYSFSILFRKSLHVPISQNVSPKISSSNCLVLDLIQRSLIHFDLIYVLGEIVVKFQLSVSIYSVFPKIFVKEAVLSPMHVFDSFVKIS